MTAVAARPAAPGATGSGAVVREVRSVAMHDPLVRPLLDELSHEYWTRYQRVLTADELRAEMEHYPAQDFAAPHGELVLVLEDGEPVAGGAFRRRTEPELGDPARLARQSARRGDGSPAVRTAELKRIWTHSAHRRQGLARVVLVELERRAVERGYRRLYLTTGPRQPEAAGLYLATGYTPLFDTGTDPEEIGPLAFEKWLEVAP
ncbi:GNAT superfamily N-acetyltransferase [Cellulosimicrobium cellulans]|nr:GNAT family N-acetyltransferase [Cellulosimicrobium cellulans]MBM7818486.1 GNAT superfamily N-acetyltransferase [Cellulosimicrobium cellulans]